MILVDLVRRFKACTIDRARFFENVVRLFIALRNNHPHGVALKRDLSYGHMQV